MQRSPLHSRSPWRQPPEAEARVTSRFQFMREISLLGDRGPQTCIVARLTGGRCSNRNPALPASL